MCVANMRGFMTNPGPAFRDSRCEPFAPISKVRVAGLNALVIRPSFGTRPENQRVAAKQIIGCIEFHNPAKNHIANRFQPRCELKKSSPHFRTHPLDIRKFGILGQFADQIERVCVAFALHSVNKSDSCLIASFQIRLSHLQRSENESAQNRDWFKIALRSRCIMTVAGKHRWLNLINAKTACRCAIDVRVVLGAPPIRAPER
jgi:hypothetical protein